MCTVQCTKIPYALYSVQFTVYENQFEPFIDFKDFIDCAVNSVHISLMLCTLHTAHVYSVQ